MFSHLTFLSRKRRSVREYANQPIDSEVLKDILEAGLRAPTSKNSRSTRFFVVEDKQLLKDFSFWLVLQLPLWCVAIAIRASALIRIVL